MKSRFQYSTSRRTLYWATIVSVVVAGVVVQLHLTAPDGYPSSTTRTMAVTTDRSERAIDLTVYSDYQCPACARYHRMLARLQAEVNGQLTVRYRHRPLDSIHPLAKLAAQAAEAARLQGAFDAMHRLLLVRQSEWAQLPPASCAATFVEFAGSLGIDPRRFEHDLQSEAVSERVADDADRARMAGIRSTPTLILNGERVLRNPRHYDALKALVEPHLRATTQVARSAEGEQP